MTKKAEILEELWEAYQAGSPDVVVEMLQKRPSTGVKVTVRLLQYPVAEEIGFSKVCWPDVYDAGRGKELAVRKALADIAKKLASQDDKKP